MPRHVLVYRNIYANREEAIQKREVFILIGTLPQVMAKHFVPLNERRDCPIILPEA
jgi:hypothetical protein